MSYSAKIICDSISETGKRLTTMEITFPRIVLAELNTHRMFSRNSASSRAIPFNKQVERIMENPFIPEKFPLNTKGMQPAEYVTKENAPKMFDMMVVDWLEMRDEIIERAKEFREIIDVCCGRRKQVGELVRIDSNNDFNKIEFGEVQEGEEIVEGIENDYEWARYEETKQFSSREIHKQLVNRLLEPFMWHTVIVTATEFDNFFKLRTNSQAQYEIRRIADLMYEVYHYWDRYGNDEIPTEMIGIITPQPKLLKAGEWHLPFISDEDWNLAGKWLGLTDDACDKGIYKSDITKVLKQVSVARCARVSYLTHDGKRDIEEDLKLFEKLRISGHWSPFEHVATPYFLDNYGMFGIKEGSYDEGDSGFHNERYCNLKSGNFIGWRQYRKEFQDENCTYFRKA